MVSRFVYPHRTGSAGLQARVQEHEEEIASAAEVVATSAAEARNYVGALNAGLKARTTQATSTLELAQKLSQELCLADG